MTGNHTTNLPLKAMSEDELKAVLIKKARRLGGELHLEADPYQTVVELCDSADMVFGVWLDDREPDGYGFLLVRGELALAEIEQAGARLFQSVAAIPCIDLEQAYSLQQHLMQLEANQGGGSDNPTPASIP